ncbi:hypothetical protein [Bradyrhizobium cajani]|uniref:Uncharacterized protein n=1 Tax=Bradyrhizobium cajani TaxID=1928661 RepID=A0A844TFD1_9BRAD|nr:hypothetical protein [Bradyrhizobium cajani]MCP3368290.1 hypothetical protein [Bradyrhizobium cajani]MVT77753.1 hypothetical protein [Bradyrhizobium cajani]
MKLIDDWKSEFHRLWTIRISLAVGVFKGLAAVLGAFTRAQWDAALARAGDQGEKARDDAERDIGAVTTDRRLFRSDPARRGGLRKITYDGENDTFETIWQIRVHNAVGRKKQCWK